MSSDDAAALAHSVLQKVAALEHVARAARRAAAATSAALEAAPRWELLPGRATPDGTSRFAAHNAANRPDFHRRAHDLVVSSVGIGTSRGATDEATDGDYARAIVRALRGGVNVIDTALCYRHQRSERAVGMGLRAWSESERGDRNGILVCSKGGYVLPDDDASRVVDSGVVGSGFYSIAPAFLADQIERSRRNLGLQTIDVYYLHNPEVDRRFHDEAVFQSRIRAAFETLERAVADGHIGCYGTATWDGYLSGLLSLRSIVDAARDVAGPRHHFRFVQLPCNVATPQARERRVDEGGTVLDVAAELGLTVIASAALAGGASPVTNCSELETSASSLTPAQLALEHVRCTPGVCTALVGMRTLAHVDENLAVSTGRGCVT